MWPRKSGRPPKPRGHGISGERLQKYLARAGVASRRKCEEHITAGDVMVNGEVVTELGTRVHPGDVVHFRGKPVEPEPLRYYLLNKPAGVISSVKDPGGRPTVVDLVGAGERVFPVGRLDLDTTGLLVVTNDGELANRLMHPRFEIDKVYVAVVEGSVSRGDIESIAAGVDLDDGRTWPAEATVLEKRRGSSVVELVIHEGRKRQVRRMMEALGHPVLNLHRRRYAMLTDDGIAPGEFRELDRKEVEALREIVTGVPDEER